MDLLQRKALILKTGDPEKPELGVQDQRHAVPGFDMREHERGETQHGDNVRQHEFCRTVCLDQLKLRAVVPEMKRVFTLNHFLKKRETFFDVHAGIPFCAKQCFLLIPVSEKLQTFFWIPRLCAAVDCNQTEGHRVAFLPFKIIQKAPVKITFYRETIADAGSDAV